MNTVRLCVLLTIVAMSCCSAVRADGANTDLARKAQTILAAQCSRCHGRDGSIEGGMNYILDRNKLIARKKIIPGDPDQSPLFKRCVAGKMPPPGEEPRPSVGDLDVLKQWIKDGARNWAAEVAERSPIREADIFQFILADLESMERRNRRFVRYFTLHHLYNAGLSDEELQTYRHALSKLLNSLSWHPRISVPKAIDAARTVLRIDLRDFQWDANLWNRILAEYPYGVSLDTAVARVVTVATATRMPMVRADWFTATACRPPLYQDLLQLPASLSELERQLRVDPTVNIQQERVARAGFNGSGVAKNNRLLERHDALHGAYWRTYDFEAIPQNLVDRENLLPDRRNLFAHPLGPGFTEASFQHIGGEVIWNLPNGLQGFMLVNADNRRVDKAPTAIVSDPKRPDKAVETGISCFSCHYAGINYKADQVRDHVIKNPRAFGKNDAELILSLYPPEARMKALMDEDAGRFRKAVEKTGGKISAYEPISMLTLRYEADLDLPTACAEVGLKPEEFVRRLNASELLSRNLGILKTAGGTIQRELWLQAFGDVIREMDLGILLKPTLSGQTLPDNTGEIDPLEGQSSPANSIAFSPDGKFALITGADRSLRLWSVEAGRDLRRFIGHAASVWTVAFSNDGKKALSGSADGTVRLWDVETGRELRKLDTQRGFVSCIAVAPDGNTALSGGYDGTVVLWDLNKGLEIRAFADGMKYIHAVAYSKDGRTAFIAADRRIVIRDIETGKQIGSLEGHTDSVTGVSVAEDGKHIVSVGDDGTVRIWEWATRKEVKVISGHQTPVKSAVLSRDGKHLVSAATDRTVRLWNAETGAEIKAFRRHSDSVLRVQFTSDEKQTVSGSRDGAILLWSLAGKTSVGSSVTAPNTTTESSPLTVLRPQAVVSVDTTIGNMHLSPNGKWLYFLNPAECKLQRINTSEWKLAGDLQLAPGVETVTMSGDGKLLYAAARSTKKEPAEGKLQQIDAARWTVTRTMTVPTDPYDLAVLDDGSVVASGGTGDWTDVIVVDMGKGEVCGRWGGVWRKSFLQYSSSTKRLYLSTQGVSPGQVGAFVIPEKPTDKPLTYTSPVAEKNPLGGEMQLSPDGAFLFAKTGSVLKTSTDRADDLQYAATLEPFLSVAVDVARKRLYLLTLDGLVRSFSYPDFKPLTTYRLGVIGYQMVLDGEGKHLIVAGLDPKKLTRAREKPTGEIYVFPLQDGKP